MSLTVQLSHHLLGFHLDMNAEIPSTGITALWGPSGAGKSMIANAIAGLLTPDHGKIQLKDRCLLDTKAGINIPTHRRHIGYVFQDARLFPHLSIKKNLAYGAKRSPQPLSKHQYNEIIELLDIEHLLNRYPAKLSGGEKQRVAIGRALMSAPQLLLLDEPFSALDQSRKHKIYPMLEQLRDWSSIPIILVSHSMEEINHLADHVLIINQGKLLSQGNLQSISRQLDLDPSLAGFETGSTITGHEVAQSQDPHLSLIEFNAGQLWVPKLQTDKKQEIRLRIRASDVIISLDNPSNLSAINAVQTTIDKFHQDNGIVTIGLLAGETYLVSRITEQSWHRLKLEKGKSVYAIIKAVSVSQKTGS